MLKCLIVDDDKMSRTSLSHLCAKDKNIELVATCENVKDALDVLTEQPVDLIFLDIEMPEASGFDLLEATVVMPHVVIISSKKEYAFDAFQYQVSDYLQKPVSWIRFKQAVEKIRSENSRESRTDSKSVFVKSEGKLIQLKVYDIDYIENVGDYAKFVTERGNHIVYITMKKLIEKLPQNQFMKVHRSFIVNLNKIKDIEDNTLVIKKKVIPISRANKAELINRLNLI